MIILILTIILSLIFLLGISLFICFLTVFKNNAIYNYIATALIMLPLITFIVLYPYEKKIYNKKFFIASIVFAVLIFIPSCISALRVNASAR